MPLMETFEDVENSTWDQHRVSKGSDVNLTQAGDQESILGTPLSLETQTATSRKGIMGRVRAVQGWSTL